MSNSDINKELEEAVSKEDLEKVRALLNKGANVNLRIESLFDSLTLLHKTHSVEITKELLLHGANVNATNRYRESPLDHAASYSKNFKIVAELLKYGADVHSLNRKGNNPLNLAIKRQTKDLEVIKLLLEHGSDINVRNRESGPYDNHSTPLENAMKSLKCGELVIRMSLIKHFDRNYRKIINLSPYAEWPNYGALSAYLNDCISEITRMKTDMVSNDLSFYKFVTVKYANVKTLKAKSIIADQAILTTYPIYHDMIWDKAKFCLKRANLLSKLCELQVYTISKDAQENRIILDFHSTYNLGKYLSYEDLMNLVRAFYKQGDKSLDFIENLLDVNELPDTKPNEASTSSCAKRARLDTPSLE